MTNAAFKPVLYVKASCPFCFKLTAFLAEAGLFDTFDVQSFWPGDEKEEAIRSTLSAAGLKASFPTVQLAPGTFMQESDDIIAHYAAVTGHTPDEMPFFHYALNGPYRRMREQFATIKDLTKKLEP